MAFAFIKELSDSRDFLHLMCTGSTIDWRKIGNFGLVLSILPGGLGANSLRRAGGSKDVIQLYSSYSRVQL
jgi:hypothetical protein